MDKSTVSNALSGKGNVSAKTRARIATVARELGYEPNPLAQRLATGYRNETICLFSGVVSSRG
jgi:LacI family transcriptional regulator